jgi:hypothetical protein
VFAALGLIGTTMTNDELFSITHLERTWLYDIVEVFRKRPNGVAEIEVVIKALLKTDRDMKSEGESTVTRTINNFCINAADIESKVKHPIFERIEPSTYRLLSYPDTPDVFEIQNIKFNDYVYKKAWEILVFWVKDEPKWKTLTKRKRLEAFAIYLQKCEPLREFLISCGREAP